MIPSLTPADLSLPPKFRSFRRGQITALTRGLSSPHKYILQSMPVGEGKSLYYIAQALLQSTRACALTASLGLQTQLLDDFSPIGLVDIRGRSNYPCVRGDSCEEGKHNRCPKGVCPYEKARTAMLASPLVETTYSYYMAATIHGRGLGDFDLLICDEAHDAPEEVCSAMAVEFTYKDASKIGHRLPSTMVLLDWQNWSNTIYAITSDKLRSLQSEKEGDRTSRGSIHPQTSREIDTWTKIQDRAATVMGAMGKWVVSKTGDGFRLEPVWARDYAMSVLFRNIPKIILTSATMVRKTMDLLGIPPDSASFFEYASSFPKERTPVYLFTGSKFEKGAGRVSFKSSPDELLLWTTRIDNIIRRRMDRKGIIHTVSYDRAEYILSHSAFSSYMLLPEKLGNGKRDTEGTIERFRKAEPPAILVSPAITTGYDFKGEQCEYNIIAKVPFMDSRDPLTKARDEEDKEYSPYMTAQTLVQALGRAMRGEDDQCENFIVDGHIHWFLGKYRHLFPFWFHRLIQKATAMPEPPASLRAGQPSCT